MHHDQINPVPPDHLEARVRKLEEALGFAEHERDQLHQHMLDLMQDLRATQRKVASLEQRLEAKDASNLAADDEPGSPSDEQ